ncbi:response regulator [Methylomicrobium lacus]|uniref:response regulator n=1 Tax=Methylomicrobium lacus TaxID=136992 RepID=UPI0035A8202B
MTPDLVLLGFVMPKKNGVAVIEDIRKYWHTSKVLVYACNKAENYIPEVFQAGADGCLLNDASTEHFIAAIKYISAGH